MGQNWPSEVKKSAYSQEIRVNFEIYFLERDSTGDREFSFISIFHFFSIFFRILYFSKMMEK